MLGIKTIEELIESRPGFTKVVFIGRLGRGEVTEYAEPGDALLLHETEDGKLTGRTLLALVIGRTPAVQLSPAPPDPANTQ